MKNTRVNRKMRNIAVLKLWFVLANVLGPFSALFFQRHYFLESSTVALVMILMSAFYLVGNLAGGLLVGRYSFRGLLVGASGCSFGLVLSSMLVSSSFVSITMVLLFMFFFGLTPPVLSVLTSLVVDDSNRIVYFGYLHLSSNLGAALLFIVGGYLLDTNSLYLLFFSMAASLLCLLFSSYLSLPERTSAAQRDSSNSIKVLYGVPRILILAGAIFLCFRCWMRSESINFPCGSTVRWPMRRQRFLAPWALSMHCW